MTSRAMLVTAMLGSAVVGFSLPKVFGAGSAPPASEMKEPFELIIPDETFQEKKITFLRANNMVYNPGSPRRSSKSAVSLPGDGIRMTVDGNVTLGLPDGIRLQVPSQSVVVERDAANKSIRIYLKPAKDQPASK